MRKQNQGFTMLEMLITLVVIAIVAKVAYGTYRNSVYKSRRSDALNTIISIQAAEEKYRSSNTSYGTLAQVWSSVTTSPQGYYTLTLTNIGATTYTITATAQGSQANDTGCTSIALAKSGATETRTPTACWQ